MSISYAARYTIDVNIDLLLCMIQHLASVLLLSVLGEGVAMASLMPRLAYRGLRMEDRDSRG